MKECDGKNRAPGGGAGQEQQLEVKKGGWVGEDGNSLGKEGNGVKRNKCNRGKADQNRADLRQWNGRIIKCQRRRRGEAEREGGKHQTTTLGLGSRGKLAQRAARGFEIWTVVNEGSVACSFLHTHTHRYTQQMGPQGLKRGYSFSLSPTQTRQI